MLKEFIKESAEKDGWYQPIKFPDGTETFNPKKPDFFDRDDLGVKKWERFIKPYLVGKSGFLEVGCNAGLYLVLAEKYGYKKVYGIENLKGFYEQSQKVLAEFNSKATVFFNNALEFNYHKLIDIDVILMANALYWMGYTDSGKYIENYEKRVEKFIKQLAFVSKRIILVGGERVDRIGGSLEKTLPVIKKYFNVIKSEVIETKHRQLNLIVGDSKSVTIEADIDMLIETLYERGDYAREFVETFELLIRGYLKHKMWMGNNKDEFRGRKVDQDRLHIFCKNYLDLIFSIDRYGLLTPIELFKEDGKAQIDGWHRLVIMKVLGEKKVKCVKIQEA